MHNPKALKFNVSKKLGQLHKVIQLFRSQIADREYQLEYLHQNYDPKINTNLGEYKTKMEAIQQIADDQTKEALEKIEKLYKRKQEVLIEESKNYVTAATENLEQFQEKMIGDIDEIERQVKLCRTQLDNKMMAVDTFVDKAKKKLEADIKKMNETFKLEAKAHDEESKKKMAQLVADSKAKIENLKEQHKKDLEELTKSFQGGTGAETKVIEKLRTLKQQLSHMKTVLAGTRDNVSDLIKTRKQQGAESRKRLADLAAELRKLMDGHGLSLDQMNQDYEKGLEDQKKEQEQMKADIEAKKQEHEAAKQKKAEEQEQERVQMNQELEDAKLRNQSNFSSADEAMKALNEQHAKELTKLRAQHEGSVKDWEVKLAQRHKEVLALQDDLVKQKQKVMDELKQTKKKNEIDIRALEDIQQNEIQYQINEFNKQMSEIQDQINSILEGGNAESQKSKGILQQLRDEKERLLREYSEAVSKYDQEHAKAIESLTNANSQELAEMTKKNATELETTAKKDDDECDALKKQLDEEFEKEKQQFEDQYKSKLKDVETLRQERSEIEKIASEFMQKCQQQEAQLNSIVAPDIENIDLFRKLDEGIQELTKQQGELLTIIATQKRALKMEWDSKIDQENERHSMRVVRSSVGTEKEQKRLALLQEIGDVSQFRKDEEQKLNAELERMKQEHERQIAALSQELTSAQSTDEADRLELELARIRKERNEQRDDIETSKNQMEIQLKQRIIDEKERHSAAIDELEDKIEASNAYKSDAVKKIQQQMEESKTNAENSCADFQAKSEDALKRMLEAHIKKIDALVKDFEATKDQLAKNGAAFQKKLKDTRSQNQSSIDEYIRRSKTEAEKREADWNEMRLFYDEKISVLTKKRDEAIQVYEQRPPRQSEIDIIERLQNALQLKSTQLQTALKEYQEYRALMVHQEREYNSRFGKGPKVGVFAVQPAPPKTAH